MRIVWLGRSGVAPTAVVSLLTLAALALLGLVLAYWTWVWFAPRAPARAEAAAAPAAKLTSASLLFGRVERKQDAAAPAGIAITLLGVVAASTGRRGYAVVQLEGKRIVAAHEAEDVAPGIRLAQVYPDHVILERGGVRETLGWPVKKGGASAYPQSAQTAAAVTAAAAAAKAVAAPVPPAAPETPAPAAAPETAAPAAAPRGGRAARRQADGD